MTVGVVRVADRQNPAVVPGRDGFYRGPQPGRDSARLVKDDEDVPPVDSLECRLRIVRGLPSHAHKATANEPPISPLDNPTEISAIMETTDFLPQDRVHLVEARGGGDHHRLIGR